MIDLHTHTLFSDGSQTPSQLVEEAAAKGLRAIAVTDHDTVDGLPEALAAGERLGVEVIAGVEINLEHDRVTMDMLGYFLAGLPSEELQVELAELRAYRAERNQRMVERLAELGLPLVTVIDTGGAALSREAEEGGLAGEIARSLADLITLPSPTLCLLLGQGGGGGALALLPADRVLAAENSWLSPLPPEGASAILYRTTDRAPEVAAAQGVRALDLRANGIVDRIVAERPDAADEPEEFVARVAQALEHELAALMAVNDGERRAARQRRYRTLGLS